MKTQPLPLVRPSTTRLAIALAVSLPIGLALVSGFVALPVLFVAKRASIGVSGVVAIIGIVLALLISDLLSDRVERIFTYFLQDVRNALEPFRIDRLPHAYAILTPSFRSKIIHWGQPSIDATCLLLDLARECEDHVLLSAFQGRRDSVQTMLNRLIDEQTGGIRQHPRARPTIYSTHLALNAVKRLSKHDYYRRPLGREAAREYFSQDALDGILRFVETCSIGSAGAFADEPPPPADSRTLRAPEPTVAATHAAFMLMWNLQVETSTVDQVFEFLTDRCFVESVGGFAETPGQEPLLCSTYFALRVIERSGHPAWLESNRDRILHFFRTLWHDDRVLRRGGPWEWGGFAPGASAIVPSLPQTALACAAIVDILGDPDFFSVNERLRLLNYLRLCRSDLYGGFKFHFAGLLYAPNVYATRMTLTALRILARHYEEFSSCYEEERRTASHFARLLAGIPDGEEPQRLEREQVMVSSYYLSTPGVARAVATVLQPLAAFFW